MVLACIAKPAILAQTSNHRWSFPTLRTCFSERRSKNPGGTPTGPPATVSAPWPDWTGTAEWLFTGIRESASAEGPQCSGWANIPFSLFERRVNGRWPTPELSEKAETPEDAGTSPSKESLWNTLNSSVWGAHGVPEAAAARPGQKPHQLRFSTHRRHASQRDNQRPHY